MERARRVSKYLARVVVAVGFIGITGLICLSLAVFCDRMLGTRFLILLRQEIKSFLPQGKKCQQQLPATAVADVSNDEEEEPALEAVNS